MDWVEKRVLPFLVAPGDSVCEDQLSLSRRVVEVSGVVAHRLVSPFSCSPVNRRAVCFLARLRPHRSTVMLFVPFGVCGNIGAHVPLSVCETGGWFGCYRLCVASPKNIPEALEQKWNGGSLSG